MKTKQPNYCSQIRFKFDPSFLKSLTSTRCLCVQHIVLFPHLWKCQLCWRVCWLDKLLRGGFNLLHASWSQKHLTSHPKTWTIVGGVTPQNPLSTDHSYLRIHICLVSFQIDAFQHMQHFVQGMQQQAQHAIAAEDQQHKLELHKLMARFALFSQRSSSSSPLFSSQRIFSCLRRGKKSTGVNDKMNDGWIPFSFLSSGFWAFTCCLTVTPSCFTLTLEYNRGTINVISNTCAFPILASQSVSCKNSRAISSVYISL